MVTIEKLRPSFAIEQNLAQIREEALVSPSKVEEIQMEHFKDAVHEIAASLDEQTVAEMGRLALAN